MENELLATAGRTAVIYVVMLVTIRLLGKRAIGNLTAFDMLIALIMGDLAGDAIYGGAPLRKTFGAGLALPRLPYPNSATCGSPIGSPGAGGGSRASPLRSSATGARSARGCARKG